MLAILATAIWTETQTIPEQNASEAHLLFRTNSAFSSDDGGLSLIVAVLDRL
jgi:hypothetical protein